MDRTPGQDTGGFDRSVKPEFDRVTKPDLIRQEEITVKSDRLLDKAWSAYQDRVHREYQEQLTQTYSAEDVKVLEKPEYSPEWGKSAKPIVGAPKSPIHAQELAEKKHDETLQKHRTWINETKEAMITSDRPLGNGIIAGTKRGGSNRRFD